MVCFRNSIQKTCNRIHTFFFFTKEGEIKKESLADLPPFTAAAHNCSPTVDFVSRKNTKQSEQREKSLQPSTRLSVWLSGEALDLVALPAHGADSSRGRSGAVDHWPEFSWSEAREELEKEVVAVAVSREDEEGSSGSESESEQGGDPSAHRRGTL